MSLATAGTEIPALAEKHGFERQVAPHVGDHHLDVMYSPERIEGFTLVTDETGAFVSASWHAPEEYRTKVDRRKPPERSDRSGLSLAGNSTRRPVGLDEVRIERITSPSGLDVGYMTTKRRIRNENWRDAP